MPRFRITTGVTFELYAKDHAEATGKAIEKLHTLDMISDIHNQDHVASYDEMTIKLVP